MDVRNTASSANPFASASVSVARVIADRLIDRDERRLGQVGDIVEAGRGLVGHSGVAIFMAAILQATGDTAYGNALHLHMKAAAHSMQASNAGLFAGLHGLIAACTYALSVEPRYQGLLQRCLDAAMPASVSERSEPIRSFSEYDLISGRAGAAIALALAAGCEAARSSCDYLAWVVEDPERWCIPHPRDKSARPAHDLGLAHGLAGVIAALAIASPFEQRYSDALTNALVQLYEKRSMTETFGWPSSVLRTGPEFGRSAWCYGTPGCAGALLAAAQRIGSPEPRAIAEDALEKLGQQPRDRWNIPDHAICHGTAGNALIFAVAGQELQNPRFSAISQELVSQLLSAFDPDSALGYRAWKITGFEDCENLLEGSAGIGLALLTLAGKCDPSWMRYFGLPPLRAGVQPWPGDVHAREGSLAS